MMVADTSPLNYLILMQRVELLDELFHPVVAPLAVRREMQHPKAPKMVRAWAIASPQWLEWVEVPRLDPTLSGLLGDGEREAISYALLHPALLLMDDAQGREAAHTRNLAVTGTLAILKEAAQKEPTDLRILLTELTSYGFRASPATLKSLLKQYYERG